jgi:hypothetical protein
MSHTLTKGALSLPYREFNAFQHGDKVLQQDLQILEDLVAEGEKDGCVMEALREVCRKAGETSEVGQKKL